jgi:hypothetical protein
MQLPSAPASRLQTNSSQSPSGNCARIKDLGFAASKRIKMYGESFEIISDPFNEGDCVVVRVISESDGEVRSLRLPVAILVGLSGRLRKN